MKDTVILAAGKNERLMGRVAPYMKPLMLVGGEALIVSLVHVSARSPRTVIVAAPQNVEPIVSLLRANGLLYPRIRIIVQPDAEGPTEAIMRGLDGVTAHEFICMCGDNVVPQSAFDAAWNAEGHAICTQVMTAQRAERFTRVGAGGVLYEGGADRGNGYSEGHARVWIGPFACGVSEFEEAVHMSGTARFLGKVLNSVVPRFKTYEGECLDIGVPDAITKDGVSV